MEFNSKGYYLPYVALLYIKTKAINNHMSNVSSALHSYTEDNDEIRKAIKKLINNGFIEITENPNNDVISSKYEITNKGASENTYNILSDIISDSLENRILIYTADGVIYNNRTTNVKDFSSDNTNYRLSEIDAAFDSLADKYHNIFDLQLRNYNSKALVVNYKKRGELIELIENGGYKPTHDGSFKDVANENPNNQSPVVINNNFYNTGDAVSSGNIDKSQKFGNVSDSQLSFDNSRDNPTMQYTTNANDNNKPKRSWLQIIYWVVGIVSTLIIIYTYFNKILSNEVLEAT